jgi:hypothetical protein
MDPAADFGENILRNSPTGSPFSRYRDSLPGICDNERLGGTPTSRDEIGNEYRLDAIRIPQRLPWAKTAPETGCASVGK